jgi:hypothetical protein
MPYSIQKKPVKSGKNYAIVNKNTGKIVGRSASKDKAKADLFVRLMSTRKSERPMRKYKAIVCIMKNENTGKGPYKLRIFANDFTTFCNSTYTRKRDAVRGAKRLAKRLNLRIFSIKYL